MNIRSATLDDIGVLVSHFVEYCNTINLWDLGISCSIDSWSSSIINSIINDDNFICNVLENDDGKIIGECAFEITRNWFNQQQEMGLERFLYVDPEYRESGHASKLLDHTLEELKEMGITQIVFPVIHNKTEKLVEALKKRGFVHFESHFVLKQEI